MARRGRARRRGPDRRLRPRRGRDHAAAARRCGGAVLRRNPAGGRRRRRSPRRSPRLVAGEDRRDERVRRPACEREPRRLRRHLRRRRRAPSRLDAHGDGRRRRRLVRVVRARRDRRRRRGVGGARRQRVDVRVQRAGPRLCRHGDGRRERIFHGSARRVQIRAPRDAVAHEEGPRRLLGRAGDHLQDAPRGRPADIRVEFHGRRVVHAVAPGTDGEHDAEPLPQLAVVLHGPRVLRRDPGT